MSSPNTKQVGGDHYSKHRIQPWDVMQEYMSPEAFQGYLQGNVIKYVLRYKDKGGVQDLEKAQHYLEMLISVQEIGKESSEETIPEAKPFDPDWWKTEGGHQIAFYEEGREFNTQLRCSKCNLQWGCIEAFKLYPCGSGFPEFLEALKGTSNE